MNLTLPLPYDDELIYSVIARHFAYTQPSRVSSGFKSIDGRAWFSRRYVRAADQLAEHTQLSWGLSGLQIIDRHTLLPFNGAFLKPETHLKCTECFLGNDPHGGSIALGLNNSSIIDGKFLRFCASCLEEDIRSFGETYWRRQHQLSGTRICVRHDEVLRDSTALMSPRGRGTEDATKHCHADFKASASLSANEMSLARSIAARSAEVLNGGLRRWMAAETSLPYRMAAIEAGYGIGMQKLDTHRFARDFVAFFGLPFLQKIGCTLTGVSMPLRKIFGQFRTSHPLIHVLVQIVLEDASERARHSIKREIVNPALRRDWKCPNVYARHDDSFRVPVVLLRRGKGGTRYLHARCSCGFAFTFTRSKNDDPHMPFVSRTSSYGEAMEAHAKRLLKKNGSVTEVAREMKLDYSTAKRLVGGSKSAFESSPERISLLRKDWLKTQSRSTYQVLLRYDRAWMLGRRNQQGRKWVSAPYPNREKEDLAFSMQIKTAAQRLRAQGKKVTIRGLAQILDRTIRVARMGSLPRTCEMLRKTLDVPSSVVERQYRRTPALGARSTV